MATQSKKILIIFLFTLFAAAFVKSLYLYQSQNFGGLGQTSENQKVWVSARLTPAQIEKKKGEEFSLDLEVDSSRSLANVFSIELNYSSQDLEFLSIDKQDSFVSIWFEEEIGPAGAVRLTAGVPNPGFQGQGRLATLKFKALQAGKSEVSFTPKSAVYRNQDNKNILGLTKNAMVEIE